MEIATNLSIETKTANFIIELLNSDEKDLASSVLKGLKTFKTIQVVRCVNDLLKSNFPANTIEWIFIQTYKYLPDQVFRAVLLSFKPKI